MNNWSLEIKMQRGLSALVEAAINLQNGLDPDFRRHHPLFMARHPFELTMPAGFLPIASIMMVWFYTHYESFYGRLAQFIWCQHKLLALRVIKVKAFPQEDQRHDMFFEAIFNCNSLIFEGATDYSGAGGTMTKDLEGLFQILSTVYGIEIETATISYKDANTAKNYIMDSRQ